VRLFFVVLSYIQKLDTKNSIYIELLLRIDMNCSRYDELGIVVNDDCTCFDCKDQWVRDRIKQILQSWGV
jgi:hypothetical protein